MRDLKISQMPKSLGFNPNIVIPIVNNGKNETIDLDQLYQYLNLFPVADCERESADEEVWELKHRAYYRLGKTQMLKIVTKVGLPYKIRFIAMPNCIIYINNIEYKGTTKKEDSTEEKIIPFQTDTMYVVDIDIEGKVSINKIEDENLIISK